MFRRALFLGLLTVACPLMGGCTLEDAAVEESLGSLSVNLVGAAADGTQYRLRNALFSIDAAGAEVLTLSTETDPDATALTADLPRGSYDITLGSPGWWIEDVATNQQVEATLISDDSVFFRIADGQVATVDFRFKIQGQIVVVGGSLNVTSSFDESASCEQDAFEPNDNETQAVNLDVDRLPLPAAICGNEDWWAIQFPDTRVGEQVTLTVALNHALGDLDAVLFKPDGTRVYSATITDLEDLPFTIESGVYRLVVTPFQGAGNNYTIDLVQTPAAP